MAELDLEAFGGALRRRLGTRSRRWLANQLGVSEQQIGRYFDGSTEPERERVFLAEQVPRCRTGDLVTAAGLPAR